MKRLLLSLAFLFACVASGYSQVFGCFGTGDPDAWFDMEIYFACQNNAVNYYNYGMNLSNVALVVDYTDVYYLNGVWQYGTWISIGKDNGIEFEKGSTVSVIVGEQVLGTWTCSESNPTAVDAAKRAWKMKPKTGRMNLSPILKILKKVKIR